MTTKTKPAKFKPGLWLDENGVPVSLEVYHSDCSAIGHSMIDTAIDNLREYHARYIARTLAHAETPALLFGSMFHTLALEPQKFDDEYMPIPAFGPDGEKWDKRITAHKQAWREIEDDPRKKYSADDATLMFRMIEALDADEQAHSYLHSDGPCEQPIRWIDPITGLILKACRDKVVEAVTINLKTCQSANPARCIKDANNYGYHRAAAHYLDGHEAVFGEEAQGHLFICVSKEQLPRVCCYELDQAAIELGRKQNRAALNKIGEAMATGDWSNPEEGKVLRLALPNYAFYSDYEVSNG